MMMVLVLAMVTGIYALPRSAPGPKAKIMRLASVLPLGAIPFYGSGKLPAHDLRGSTALELSTASTGD